MKQKKYEQLIQQLQLIKHIEGGYYKRFFESKQLVETHDGKKRFASTAIYYLLTEKDFSVFHRIDAEEMWHYYEGNTPLQIHMINDNGDYHSAILDPNQHNYQYVVSAHTWFAAELMHKNPNHYALCACTVTPGFNGEILAEYETLSTQFPQHEQLIRQFTR